MNQGDMFTTFPPSPNYLPPISGHELLFGHPWAGYQIRILTSQKKKYNKYFKKNWHTHEMNEQYFANPQNILTWRYI